MTRQQAGAEGKGTYRQHARQARRAPRVTHGKTKLLLGAIAVTTAIAGCADVTIRKVPAPTQYQHWTDSMQQNADEMEGFRFYLPRPFLVVFESFPVRTDVYLAQGIVSPDGRYVLVQEIVTEPEFDAFGTKAGKASTEARLKIPFTYIETDAAVRRAPAPETPSAPVREEPTAQAGGQPLEGLAKILSLTASGADGPVELLARGFEQGSAADLLELVKELRKPTTTQPVAGLAPKLEAPGVTGFEQRTVTNDNSLFAYQPLRGNFDIAYLPDFEEQYVVSNRAGLGNARFTLNLGQGWSLQGFNSVADNSALNRRIFDLIDSAVQLAKSAAYAAAGFPFPVAPVAQAAGEGPLVMTPERALKAGPELAGTPVTLKIVVVHYAAKGLYPVIKPRELQSRLWPRVAGDVPLRDKDGSFAKNDDGTTKMAPGWVYAVADAHKGDVAVINLADPPAKPCYASEMNLTTVEKAAEAHGNVTGLFTVPYYPYQYVSFNTFRYVAIEAINPTVSWGGPYGEQVYHGTGTSEDRGLARENGGSTGDSDGSGTNSALGEESAKQTLDRIAKKPITTSDGWTIHLNREASTYNKDEKNLLIYLSRLERPEDQPQAKISQSALEHEVSNRVQYVLGGKPLEHEIANLNEQEFDDFIDRGT